jgi:nitrite reductase/ring-hydroxylating ferredoxin subunit
MAKIHANFAKIHAIFAIIAFSSLFMMTSSCKEDDPISHRYPCRFRFYVQGHETSIIFSACRSAGSYVYIYTRVDNHGLRHVLAQSNSGKQGEEDNIIATAKENNYSAYMLGASNEIGLIVGRTNFNGLIAYDRICPNCPGLIPLTWTGNRQQVECTRCKRTYDLETGSKLSGDKGDPLLRYGASFDEAVLVVGN